MTYLKNNKALVFIIAVLLLSNIALLYFFVWKDKGEKKQGNKSFREYMIQTLRNDVGFNDSQIAQYEQLSNKHKEAMKSLSDGIKEEKKSLYKLLLDSPVQDSLFNYHLNMIGEKQKNIDQKIFNHFLTLREVCTQDQRPKYDSLVQGVTKNMIDNSSKKDGKKK